MNNNLSSDSTRLACSQAVVPVLAARQVAGNGPWNQSRAAGVVCIEVEKDRLPTLNSALGGKLA